MKRVSARTSGGRQDTRADNGALDKRRAWRPAARYVMTTSEAGKRAG
jgi:hypothetical protein